MSHGIALLSRKLVAAFFVICLSFGLATATALRSLRSCVQCTAGEGRCDSGIIVPTPCAGQQQYCGTYRVFIGNSYGVFRGCSNQWVQGCRRKVLDNEETTICYHTCSWDGCNAGYDTDSPNNYLI